MIRKYREDKEIKEFFLLFMPEITTDYFVSTVIIPPRNLLGRYD